MKQISVSALLTICLLMPAAARADNLGYAGAVSGAVGVVDLSTGTFSVLENAGVTFAGLAAANGLLFAASYHTANGILYSLNTTTGSLNTVGTATGVNYDDFGSTTSGLYVVSFGSTMNLYSINPSTGAATLIGPTGLSYGSYRCLSNNSSVLYFANGTDLYTLNTSTGAATLVGALGGVEMSVMIMEGGILYGSDVTNSTIDTINATTGAATKGPSLGSSSQLWGIAPDPVPAPHPSFFTGEAALSGGVYYLQFPNGNIFGYYNYQFFPVLYHYDLGFEYFIDANDGKGGAFLYDFSSGHWLYTSPSYPFPYLYDFSLQTVLYYYPNTSQPGHYTTNPRYFYNFATGKIITM